MAKPTKPPPDPRGGHVRLHWDLLDSNAWRCLSASDQRAYIALKRNLRSTNNGDLSLAMSVAKPQGIKSQTTLAKSLRALVAVGLIAVTRRGGCASGGQRLPTLYRVTDQEAYPNPVKFIDAAKATNEWKLITTLGMGRQALRDAEAAAKEEAAKLKKEAEKTKAAVQKLVGTSPEIGVVGRITSPEIGRWTPPPLQKLDLGKKTKSVAKPVLVRVSL